MIKSLSTRKKYTGKKQTRKNPHAHTRTHTHAQLHIMYALF
jgi:hypothetical protein